MPKTTTNVEKNVINGPINMRSPKNVFTALTMSILSFMKAILEFGMHFFRKNGDDLTLKKVFETHISPLSDVIQEMSPNEQLVLLYLCSFLIKSLTEYKGSLEEFQKCPKVVALTALLFEIGEPQEAQQAEAIRFVVCWLSSMIYKDLVDLPQVPIALFDLLMDEEEKLDELHRIVDDIEEVDQLHSFNWSSFILKVSVLIKKKMENGRRSSPTNVEERPEDTAVASPSILESEEILIKTRIQAPKENLLCFINPPELERSTTMDITSITQPLSCLNPFTLCFFDPLYEGYAQEIKKLPNLLQISYLFLNLLTLITLKVEPDFYSRFTNENVCRVIMHIIQFCLALALVYALLKQYKGTFSCLEKLYYAVTKCDVELVKVILDAYPAHDHNNECATPVNVVMLMNHNQLQILEYLLLQAAKQNEQIIHLRLLLYLLSQYLFIECGDLNTTLKQEDNMAMLRCILHGHVSVPFNVPSEKRVVVLQTKTSSSTPPLGILPSPHLTSSTISSPQCISIDPNGNYQAQNTSHSSTAVWAEYFNDSQNSECVYRIPQNIPYGMYMKSGANCLMQLALVVVSLWSRNGWLHGSMHYPTGNRYSEFISGKLDTPFSVQKISNELIHKLREIILCKHEVQNVTIHVPTNDMLTTHNLIGTIIRLLQEQLNDNFTFKVVGEDSSNSSVVMCHFPHKDACVVGIPSHKNTGSPHLHYAYEEAIHVSHSLQCHPIIGKDATTGKLVSTMKNADIIHLAMHMSCDGDFFVLDSSSDKGFSQQDLEKCGHLDHTFLAVLNGCNSGKGQLLRAFVRSGVQAVISTDCKIEDKAACIFMLFLYQYLNDGFCGSEALYKAMVSLRCFDEYSEPNNWSTYWYTGREVQIQGKRDVSLQRSLGAISVFPQLDAVTKLESAFLKDLSSDVQVLHGPPGVKLSEPLIDFIHCHHLHFTGGIFWINCRTPESRDASFSYIKDALNVKELTDIPNEAQPSLVVLDSLDQIPKDDLQLLTFLKRVSLHIVIISENENVPDELQRSISQQLPHNTKSIKSIKISELTKEHVTQRIVHSVLQNQHLAPTDEHRDLFQMLATMADGSPHKTNTLCSCANRLAQDPRNASIKLWELCHNEEGVLSEKQKIYKKAILSLYEFHTPIPRQIVMNAISDISNNDSLGIFQFLETMGLIYPYPSPIIHGAAFKENDMISVTEEHMTPLLPLLLYLCK